jgi:hypothetical protein
LGKLSRGALWLVFWPAGALASARAGRRKDTDKIVAAIHNGKADGLAEPTEAQLAFRADLEQRLAEAGSGKRSRLAEMFRAGWSATRR